MPQVFISYSSRDRGFVEQLARDLVANGITPWFDKWEMGPGDSLIVRIGSAILEQDYFVAVISPDSVRSEWVQQELSLALNREFQQRQVRVIPALLRDTEIPAFLRDKVYADFGASYIVGLTELLNALGRHASSDSVGTSAPSGHVSRVIWDNVIGWKVIGHNVREDYME